MTEDHVRSLLTRIIDPHSGVDLVHSQTVKAIAINDNQVAIDIILGYPAATWHQSLAEEIKKTLESDAQISKAVVNVSSRIHAHKVQNNLTPLPSIKNIIAVASGKGGVGKSTTATNLALALHAEGASVGILDADIYGPSQPRMMGVSGKPDTQDGKTLEPKQNFGVKVMSIGLMIEEDTPMIWRGPMVTQALQQLLSETHWGDLDYLIIDMPPGTGDIQLTLCQRIPVSGAVIVTTPQDIALLDARKGLKMFEKVEVPVLGIVENMSLHVCTHCGHADPIFGEGGGERIAQQYGVPLLGSLPLDTRIRAEVDIGRPTVATAPDSDIAHRYRQIARNTSARLALQIRNKAIAFPSIKIEHS